MHIPPPPRNIDWLRWLLGVLLVLGSTLSAYEVASAQPVMGERDYVPNGSFEQITIDHQKNPLWPAWGPRYLFVSRWWRQFHRYMLENSTAPPFIIPYDDDRVPYIPAGTFYDPVSCSSADLFTSEQEQCIPGVGGGSTVGIPENWFGYEPTRVLPDAANVRYAGLYYRLNGVDANNNVIPSDIVADPATELWREYLEVELLGTLGKGVKYSLSYYVSLAEASTRAISLEARVSPNPYLTTPQNSYLDACANIIDNDGPTAHVGIPYTSGNPGLSLVSAGPLLQRDGWVLVKHEFIGKGGEKYLTIGNFDEQPIATVLEPVSPVCQNYYSNPNAPEFAYYFIDDIRLTEVVECFCSKNDQAFRVDLVPVPSQDPTKCCYQVRLVNGGAGRKGTVDDMSNVCTIYGLDIHETEGPNTVDRVFKWESRDASAGNPTKQPVVGDNQWYDLGTVCLPALDRKYSSELVVFVKGKDGNPFCEQRISYRGCSDECYCDDFGKSVRIEPVLVKSEKCCYNVYVDASKLKPNCIIGSVDVYSDMTFLDEDRVTETYTPDKPVDSRHSGFLYSFCIESTNGPALTDSSTIVFRGVDGRILCWKNIQLTCDCDCRKRPPRLELRFEGNADARNDPSGKCCYKISIAPTTACPFDLDEIRILTDENVSLTPESGWGLVRGNSSVTLRHSLGPIHGNTSSTIGKLCVPSCFSFDPQSLIASANITVGGVACSVKVDINSPAKACRGNATCDDVIVTLEKPKGSAAAFDDCCRFVRIRLRNCQSINSSVFAEVIGPGGIPIKAMNLGSGIFESAPLCRSYRQGETFTIHLRGLDGNIICTKKLVVPACSRRETNE